ncbi:hypothetical protein MKW94_024418 [Papaver nudicaule]|uniref:Tetraspanin-8 n=1 Tax=Papaver nudicaule TaxID=74823 RepID=A0AA42AT00_PAPNU|nr:hypothetical protein [Papaver nudicaule]
MAFKFHNFYFSLVSVISFILSIPILVSGIWLIIRSTQTKCELLYLEVPLISCGLILLIVSALGIVSAQLRQEWLVIVYWIVMGVAVWVLFGFTVWGLVISGHGGGEVVKGSGFKEYKLDMYHHWFKRRINVENKWNCIRKCLRERNVCDSLSEQENLSPKQFYLQHLSSIQSGCCKPPTQCGLVYRSPTHYDRPVSFKSSNPDCTSWNNTDLCFNCNACKAGVLENMRMDWKIVGKISIVCVIFLILIWFGISVFICGVVLGN